MNKKMKNKFYALGLPKLLLLFLALSAFAFNALGGTGGGGYKISVEFGLAKDKDGNSITNSNGYVYAGITENKPSSVNENWVLPQTSEKKKVTLSSDNETDIEVYVYFQAARNSGNNNYTNITDNPRRINDYRVFKGWSLDPNGDIFSTDLVAKVPGKYTNGTTIPIFMVTDDNGTLGEETITIDIEKINVEYGNNVGTSFYVGGKNLSNDVSVKVNEGGFLISGDGGNNWDTEYTITSPVIPNFSKQLMVKHKQGSGLSDGKITLSSRYAVAQEIRLTCIAPVDYNEDEVNSVADLGWAVMHNEDITLADDIDMSGWIEINEFNGNFDGNGHCITGLTSCLFETVSGGEVKNLNVSGSRTGTNSESYYGLIANEITGGSISGCIVNGSMSGNGKFGGVVGKVTGGTVSSCISMVAPTNDCGSIAYEANLSDCYATVSGDLVKTGNLTRCYNRESNEFYGDDMVKKTITGNADFGYGRKGCEVGDDHMIDLLKNGNWTQPVTTSINQGYPVLKLEGFNAMAEDEEGNLFYGDLSELLTQTQGNVFFYGKGDYRGRSLECTRGDFYIDEDAALIVDSDIQAHTSRFIEGNTSKGGNYLWHHYSPSVMESAIGIQYDNNTYNWDIPCTTTLAEGLFPDNALDWNLYCYFEPEYHWINFKRNQYSHWHSDGEHANIVYKNETKLTPGKGYLVALGESSYVQATGSLNHGTVEIPVTVSDLSATPGAKLQGVNLLGNPYQSYLSFQAFADGNPGLWNGTATYLTYDPEGDYYTQGSTAIASSGSQASSVNLSMHQGFFIVSDKPVGNYTATFTDAMCSVNPEGDVHFRGEKFAYPLVNLMVRDSEGVGDLAVVEFDRPEFAAAPKLFNYGGKGKVYFSYENEDDALLFLSEAIDQLPIHFDALEDGDYTLSWSTANADFSYLHLIDNMTGADIDMLTRDSYSFSATTTDYSSRFKMKFSYTGIEENADAELAETFAFVHDGNLVVNGQGLLEIIDMNGRTVSYQQLADEQNIVGIQHLTPSIYVVRLMSDKASKVQKIIVR